ncbi:hypothetical protein LguiA_007735 [Lonicera macranthoides]
MKCPSVSSGLGCTINSLDNSCNSYQELGINVVEIVNDSWHRAQTMVDTAIQVFSSVKEGEDAFSRIGVALDSLGRQKPTPDSGSTHQHQLTSTSPELSLIGGASIPVFHHDSDSSEAQIPSELITS